MKGRHGDGVKVVHRLKGGTYVCVPLNDDGTERDAVVMYGEMNLIPYTAPPRLDPRESEPVAMESPAGKVMHDGQANTSGVEREPLGRGLASAILDAYREHTTPSTLTVSEGIVRWQQADPRHRQVHVTYTGHVVVATVALLDGSAPRLIKFVRPFPAADVIGFLDGLIAVPPHEPVTMGRIDFDPQEAR